jgi:hypothetical protein
MSTSWARSSGNLPASFSFQSEFEAFILGDSKNKKPTAGVTFPMVGWNQVVLISALLSNSPTRRHWHPTTALGDELDNA